MPVGLTLFGAIFATVGFFITIYGLVILVTEGRRAKAKPRLGLAPGVGPGTVSVWVNWDPSLFNLQIYRLRISHVSPELKSKEGTFTVTFANPQTQPFIQPVELPASFREIVESQTSVRSLVTFEFRTIDEMSLFVNCHARNLKKIYRGLKTRMPKITNILPVQAQDVATVFSLDFEELQARKKRMKDLEAAAKAKAAKAAAAKPAAAPAPAVAPKTEAKVEAPAPAAKVEPKVEIPPAAPKVEVKVETAAPAPAPKVEAKVEPTVPAPKVEDKKTAVPTTEAPQDKPAAAKPSSPEAPAAPAVAKSVRDLVSATNKTRPE
jgi:hypothetical protein